MVPTMEPYTPAQPPTILVVNKVNIIIRRWSHLFLSSKVHLESKTTIQLITNSQYVNLKPNYFGLFKHITFNFTVNFKHGMMIPDTVG